MMIHQTSLVKIKKNPGGKKPLKTLPWCPTEDTFSTPSRHPGYIFWASVKNALLIEKKLVMGGWGSKPRRWISKLHLNPQGEPGNKQVPRLVTVRFERKWWMLVLEITGLRWDFWQRWRRQSFRRADKTPGIEISITKMHLEVVNLPPHVTCSFALNASRSRAASCRCCRDAITRLRVSLQIPFTSISSIITFFMPSQLFFLLRCKFRHFGL